MTSITKAPAFELQGSDGKTHRLSDYAGKPIVLYFYPRDSTPGCTTEACDFRDNFARVQSKGAVVFGVSKDTIASHEKFIGKYDLNFVLLSDPDLAAHRAYEAYGEKKLYGKVSQGVIRSTFLIDGQGNMAKAWRNVKVKGHVEKVLEELEGL